MGYNENQTNWDLLAIYTGETPGWTCAPACIHTVHLPGLKWGLVWQLTTSNFWQDLRARYRYVMFPDADLQLGPCVASAVFDTMAAFGLLLAQPSICQGGGSYTRQLVSWRGRRRGGAGRRLAGASGGRGALGRAGPNAGSADGPPVLQPSSLLPVLSERFPLVFRRGLRLGEISVP